jgi:DNA-binding LytR/AlgR family response regulator
MQVIIGICDDNLAQLELVSEFTARCLSGTAYSLICSTDPEDFLIRLKAAPPQVVLLDIDIPGMNGITLGKKIRLLYPGAVLIYITAHEEYAYEAYQVRAFHYLLKPLTLEKFRVVLTEALDSLKNEKPAEPERTFSVQLRGEMLRLPYSDILYFEKVGHKIKICTAARDIFYYGQLYDLLNTLEPSQFVRCHQGFIVNLDKIRSFKENTLFLDGNISLPVGKTYVDTVRSTLARYLFAGKAPL